MKEAMEFPRSKKFRSSRLVYQNPHQQIYRITLDFGEYKKNYYVLNALRRVGVVALKIGAILLVRQYRLMLDGLSYEIPGGRVDRGESPLGAAVRETYEETGVTCRKMKQVLFYHVGLDTNYNPTYIFYSDHVREEKGCVNFHQGEVSSFEWVPVKRCLKMIEKGKIVDSMSIIAILACREKHLV